MNTKIAPEHHQTIIIGGGQAGLSAGYHLQRLGHPFVILDANERTGDAWRNRWDSLRVFTPAKYDGLDGMKVSAPRNRFITKDDMADYLESYATKFDLPIRHGIHADRLCKSEGRFEVTAGERRFTADQVIIAMGKCQSPRVPSFATELSHQIRQLHSIEYRNPSQLLPGGVLIVGAGNSGAEIAKDVVGNHATWVSGRDVGQIPFRVSSPLGLNVLAPLVLRFVFHRVLTIKTPMGRRMRPSVLTEGGPLIRVKRKELDALGVQRVGRTAGVRDGKPVMEDGRVLDVANVIWCTGFHAGLSWIDLPVHGEVEPLHKRGVARDEPGLYFVGLEFQYSMSSEMIHGVGRDAKYIAARVSERIASLATGTASGDLTDARRPAAV